MNPQLYRKRIIPDETVKLTGDEIVYIDENIIVTKWKPIKPRNDIGRGESCYIIDKGVKVSRFYDADFNFSHWYCDIIDTEQVSETNEYIFTDLLADVVVYSDGFVKVLDLDEFSVAMEKGLISQRILLDSLKKLSWLLEEIYKGGLYRLCGAYLDMAFKQ